jgi:hypothetical protein
MSFRRKRVQQLIARDPVEVTVYPKRANADASVSSFTATGRLAEIGNRSSTVLLGQPGEQPVGRTSWLLTLPYDTPDLDQGDEVVVTTAERTRYFSVVFAKAYDAKWEVLLDERD